MNKTVLTTKQTKVYGPKTYKEHGKEYRITATIKHDDECRNGHNTFSITGEITRAVKLLHGGISHYEWQAGGCLHEDIAKHFPELAPFIKYHLMDTDQPLHYIANPIYWASEHGPTHAWVYYTGCRDPLKIQPVKEQLLGYEKAHIAKEAEGKPGYRVVWDEKTIKVRNLEHARSSAVWPEATDEELTAPGLEMRLNARLPKLMEEFQQAVESLGLVY